MEFVDVQRLTYFSEELIERYVRVSILYSHISICFSDHRFRHSVFEIEESRFDSGVDKFHPRQQLTRGDPDDIVRIQVGENPLPSFSVFSQLQL